MRTFDDPKEIGFAAAFLVSKEAAYIMDATLFVDGGMSQLNDE